jgi:hypothetical protein
MSNSSDLVMYNTKVRKSHILTPKLTGKILCYLNLTSNKSIQLNRLI